MDPDSASALITVYGDPLGTSSSISARSRVERVRAADDLLRVNSRRAILGYGRR